MDSDDLVRAMVGRDLPAREVTRAAPGAPVLEVERLTREGVFLDISFEVRAGEIVALAGLVGAGRSEVARAIFGIDSYDAGIGDARAGARLRRASPTAAMAAGVGFVPEDRRQQGLVMPASIASNIVLASLRRLARFGFIRRSAENRLRRRLGGKLQIKYGRLSNPVSSLSGGNQQKVVLAKWLARRPSLLIVDEPTRGIDVGTKAEVHRLLDELAGEGVAILMISSELPEVLRVADRILVMREGRLVAEFDHTEWPPRRQSSRRRPARLPWPPHDRCPRNRARLVECRAGSSISSSGSGSSGSSPCSACSCSSPRSSSRGS